MGVGVGGGGGGLMVISAPNTSSVTSKPAMPAMVLGSPNFSNSISVVSSTSLALNVTLPKVKSVDGASEID